MIVSQHARRYAPLRHVMRFLHPGWFCGTKSPSPQLLYFPHLQNRDARNSFRFRSYANLASRTVLRDANCRGVSPAFSSRRLDVQTFRCSDASRNSFALISFTDPHPLTLLKSYRFKNSEGEGACHTNAPYPSKSFISNTYRNGGGGQRASMGFRALIRVGPNTSA